MGQQNRYRPQFLRGDGGPAISAFLNYPQGVALDADGSIFLSTGDTVRKVSAATRIITTVAGREFESGFSGDGAAATNSSLRSPIGVAVDGAGNILVADSANNRIRRVSAHTGVMTTVAGNGIHGFSGDGGAATSASLR